MSKWPLWQGVVGLAILGAILSLGGATSWAKNRRTLIEQLETAGIDQTHPEALKRVEREGTPHHSRLLTARSLVYDSLARLGRPGAANDPAVKAEILERLPLARELAQSSLLSEPGSWQAAMLLGTSVYLERSLARDRRLYTESADWEKPLRFAVERAHGHPEPRRLLATAYLESWEGLSAEKRELAKDLLKRVFEDDFRAFEALIPAWLALRLSTEETFSVVPSSADAWRVLKKGYAADKRWGRCRIAHQRFLESLEAQLHERREEAERRLRFGDFFRARSRFLRIISGAPPSDRFVPLINRVLEVYPPGLHGHTILDPLLGWLDWALELGQIDRRPIPPELLRRLIDAVGELDRPRAALAAMLAEDPYQAERFEKLARPLKQEAWAPYLVVKARRALEQGKVAIADEALSQVIFGKRREAGFLLTELEVARALGDTLRVAEAEEALAEVSAERWTGLQWRRHKSRPTLTLLPERAAAGFAFEVKQAPRDGLLLEVFLDGRSVALRAARPGDVIRVEAPVEAGRLHFIEVRFVEGGTNMHPGDLWLSS